MVWAFPWRKHIGVIFGEAEICAAVLQREAASLWYDCGAETTVVAVDEGDCITVCVGAAEVDGVALEVGWGAVDGRGDDALGVELLCALGQVGGRYEVCGGDFDDVGVCDEPVGVGKGDSQGFDDGVEICCGIMVFEGPLRDCAGLLELLDYTEGHEGDDSLTVGWMLPEFDATVGVGAHALAGVLERDWVDRLGAGLCMVLQIVQGEESTKI